MAINPVLGNYIFTFLDVFTDVAMFQIWLMLFTPKAARDKNPTAKFLTEDNALNTLKISIGVFIITLVLRSFS